MTTSKAGGERFARVVKRDDGYFVILIRGLKGGQLSAFYWHDEWECEQVVNMVNDAHAESVKPLIDALNIIACYDEGEVVTSSFDDPDSARIARKALEDFQ